MIVQQLGLGRCAIRPFTLPEVLRSGVLAIRTSKDMQMAHLNGSYRLDATQTALAGILPSDLSGKVVIVTGATDGIGKVTALELARRGATVVGVGRNPEKCAAVEKELRALSVNPAVEFIVGDLSSQQDVHAVADTFLRNHRRLDVLVNNAGGVFYSRQESVDGIEITWALNHLAYFLLTNRLLDLLKASAPSRVVSVSSGAHSFGKINFDDLEFKNRSVGWRAYGQSKLANILFAKELARRLEGTGVTSNVLHPGLVASRFGRSGNGVITTMMGWFQGVAAITPEQGAQTSLFLAASPEVEGVTGLYFDKCKPVTPSAAAQDMDVARRLWAVSEEMVGMAVTA